MSVRVRFAPSPTGYLHIGSLRTALYNYLYAKKHGGQYVLRIEDTDRTRFVEGAIENLVQVLEWAGVVHDEGFFIEENELVQKGEYGSYIQSERLEIYKKHIEELLEAGHAYYCFCDKERLDKVREEQRANKQTPMYDGHCREVSLEEARKRVAAGEEYTIRLKMPKDRNITFKDAIRGEVTINTNEIDDQVLIKSDGFPTYHFAVVVDDYYMKITHVVRGEEWLTSTPKHVYMFEAFGWDAPEYVHLPTVLNKDKKKLSKRQGDVAVEDFRKKGYLKEALVNYLALVGWSPESNKEIFSMEELIEEFSFERVSKSGGVFDLDKLNWVNAQYIKMKEPKELAELIAPYIIEAGYMTEEEVKANPVKMELVAKTLQEKLSYLAEVKDMAKMFFVEEVEVEEDAKEMLEMEHISQLANAFEAELAEIEEIDFDFAKGVMKKIQKATGVKGKNLFMPVRAMLTGQLHGPDMVGVIELLGKEGVLKRIAAYK